MSSMTLSTTQGKLWGFIITWFIVGLGLSGCGGGGGGGGDSTQPPPPQPLPNTVILEGRVHDGAFAPLSNAVCRFIERQSERELSHTTATIDGAFQLTLPLEVTGFIRCHPRGYLRLALTAFVSTQGQVSGTRLREDVTPASTVIADTIASTHATDPRVLQARLRRDLDLGDPDLTVLVRGVQTLFQAMVEAGIDSTADFAGESEGGGGGTDDGGADGEAGDGGEFSPIPSAVCEFSLDRAGQVRANTVVADLFADGRVDRADLQPIAARVNATIDAEQRRAITRAFARLFPNGFGPPIRTVADGPNSDTPGRYSLPLPAGVPGVIRCFPPEQPNLVFSTCVRARMANETLSAQDVTPGTTVLCDLVTEVQQADPRADRDATKNDLAARLVPLRIFLSEDRNGNGVQDAEEQDKNEDGVFSTLVELESDEPLTDDNRDLALLVSTATTIFDTMRIRREELFDDRTFEEARRDFFDDAQFESDFLALEPDVVEALDAENNLAVLGTNDIVGAATTGTLRGTVTDAEGTPVPEVQIELSQAGIPIGEAVVTDVDGRFNIPEIPVGDTTITALKDGFQLLRVTTTVVAIVTIDLELRPTPQIEVLPTVAVFGEVEVGSLRTIPVRLANVGAADLTISDVRIDASAASGYTFGQQPTSPVTLTPGSEVTVQVRFQPQVEGTALGTLIVDSDAENAPTARITLIGVGAPQPVPQIDVSPAHVTFGRAEVGSSRLQSVVLSNTGTANLTITDLTIASDGSSDFSLADPPAIPVVVPPQGALRVRLRYSPSAEGTVRGGLHVNSDAKNAQRLTVALQGQGEALPTSQIEASTNVLSFGEVEVRRTGDVGVSITKSVEIVNTGGAPLTITAIRVDASQGQAFKLQQTPVVPIVVTAGAAVPINISYEPTTIGSITGRLRVRSDAANTSELTVGLRGTGVLEPLAQLALSASEVSFGDVEVGQERLRSIVLSNTGTGPLRILSLGIDPVVDLTTFTIRQAPQTPFMVSPGAEVTLRLSFAPKNIGSLVSVLRIDSDAGQMSTATVALSGSGVDVPTPELTLSDSALVFGNVQVGMSRTQEIELSNSGTADLVIAALSIDASEPGAFDLVSAPSVPVTVKPGATATVRLRYRPSHSGSTTGTLQVEHNAPEVSGSRHREVVVPRQTGGTATDTAVTTITLSGTGTPMPVPVIDVHPLELDFGDVEIGSSTTQQVSITNTGHAALTLSGVTIGAGSSGDFGLLSVPAFPVVVTPGATIAAAVTYQPTAPGSVTGTVEITSDATNSPTVIVPLSGTGESVPVAHIDVQPAALAFGEVEIGTSQSQTLTVTNLGTADLTVTDWGLTGADFSLDQAPGLPTVILPGNAVQVSVAYQPMAVGSTTGILAIQSNAANEPTLTVNLSGTGQATPIAQMEVQPTALVFGEVEIGTSQSQTITVRNVGTADLGVLDLVVTDGDFSLGLTPNLPMMIVPNAAVEVEVVYQPTVAGFVTGTLEVQSDAANESSVVVSLTGTGQAASVPQIEVQPAALAFGEVEIGSTQSQTLTIRNVGTADLTVSELSVTGSDFDLAQAPGLPVAIVPNAAVEVQVVYQPTVAGAVTGTLEILSDAADNSLVTVDLSGTGQVASVAQIEVQPAALAFGEVEIGSSPSQTVTLRNVGTANLMVSELAVTGSDFDLAQTPDLPVVIVPNEALQVEVVYQPTAPGSVTGILEILSDAADNSLVTVDLSGTGETAPVAQINVQPAVLGYGDVAVGSNQIQTVTVNNVGTADLTVLDLFTTGGDFSLSQAPTLPIVIVPGAAAQVDVIYQPIAVGSTTGTLTLQSDVPTTPQVIVSLGGTGIATPVIGAQPAALTLAPVAIGQTQSSTLTITNLGLLDLTVTALTLTGSDFVLGQTPVLPLVLLPGTSEQVEIVHQPMSAGPVAGSLAIVSDAVNGSPLVIPFEGVAQIDVQPLSLAFGNISVGNNQTQTVTLTNTGNASLTITALTVSGGDFGLGAAPGLPAAILPGASVSVAVTYQPSVEVRATGSLVIDSDAPDGPSVTVSLSGTGAPAVIQQTTR